MFICVHFSQANSQILKSLPRTNQNVKAAEHYSALLPRKKEKVILSQTLMHSKKASVHLTQFESNLTLLKCIYDSLRLGVKITLSKV